MLVNLKGLRSRNKNRLSKGVYELRGFNKFNFDHYLEDCGVNFYSIFEDNDDEYECFGVCDNFNQIIDQFPDLLNSTSKYVIGLSKVKRAEQRSVGGWRWCKWGEYIGNKEITAEYLYDEENIDQVYCFKIYRIK